jgi:hypothetical protein
MINFTVIYHFIYKEKSGKYGKHLVLPLIGLCIISYVWINLDPAAKTLGAAWVAVGIVYYLVIVKVLKRNVDLEV